MILLNNLVARFGKVHSLLLSMLISVRWSSFLVKRVQNVPNVALMLIGQISKTCLSNLVIEPSWCIRLGVISKRKRLGWSWKNPSFSKKIELTIFHSRWDDTLNQMFQYCVFGQLAYVTLANIEYLKSTPFDWRVSSCVICWHSLWDPIRKLHVVGSGNRFALLAACGSAA